MRILHFECIGAILVLPSINDTCMFHSVRKPQEDEISMLFAVINVKMNNRKLVFYLLHKIGKSAFKENHHEKRH
jgi:hypothetical protein